MEVFAGGRVIHVDIMGSVPALECMPPLARGQARVHPRRSREPVPRIRSSNPSPVYRPAARAPGYDFRFESIRGFDADRALPSTRREPHNVLFHDVGAAVAEDRQTASPAVIRMGDRLAPGTVAATVHCDRGAASEPSAFKRHDVRGADRR